jgi:DNA-binding MarR family transcriptional regulator
MDNKILGILLIVVCILFGGLFFVLDSQMKDSSDSECSCISAEDGGVCPHKSPSMWPIHLGITLISGVAALGAYLFFFDKSQKAIISTLERQKKSDTLQERFEILMRGLNDEEKTVIKAVREQNGITQQTLRYRTDLHKSKLSIVLDGLEKKGLIRRIPKGKTNQVFIKIAL